MEEIYKVLDAVADAENRLSLLEEILKDMKEEEENLFLKNYIQYEKKIMSNIWIQKNRAVKLENYTQCESYRRKLKQIKRYISKLNEFTLNRCSVEAPLDIQTSSDSVSRPSFLDSFSDRILEFDRFCHTNLLSKLQELETSENVRELLENIKQECLNNRKQLKKMRQEARNASHHEMLQYISELTRTQTILFQYLDHSISICNRDENIHSKKVPSYEEIFGKEENYTEKQFRLIGKIVNQEEFSVRNWADVVVSLKAVIQNFSFSDVSQSIYVCLDRIIDADIRLDVKELYYLSIIDTLKHKKNLINSQYKVDHDLKLKANSKEISKIIKNLEDQVLIGKTDFYQEEEFFDYQVIEYCTEHRVPYYYLKKIISSRPSLAFLEKDGQSILVSVLEKYIESQKIELRNHRRDYIPKEYYGNFYQLLKTFGGQFSKITYDRVDVIVSEFRDYLRDSGYKEENKNKALEEFSQLVDDKKKISYSTPIPVEEYSNNLKAVTPYLVNSKKRVMFDFNYLFGIELKVFDYQDSYYALHGSYPDAETVCSNLNISMNDYNNAMYHCSTICLGDSHHSYSLLQDGKGSTYLRMHVFDLTAYIQEDNLLEKYLLDNAGKKFRNPMRYLENSPVVSLTYQIKLFPNGTVGNLKIYPSVANVQKNYSSLENYRQDSVLKSYVATYKKLSQQNDAPKNIAEIDQFFSSYITERVLKFCDSENLPIILRGKRMPDEISLMHIQSDLGPIFSKMDRKQFQFYSNILLSQLDALHYANQNFEDGNYVISLDRVADYVDLFNQRLLLSSEKILLDSAYLDSYKEKSDELVGICNEKIGYVDDRKFEKCKRKRHVL